MTDLEAHGAFAKLSDGTRVEILRAIAEAEREDESLTGMPTLSFSELYERVGATNSSGFAYHLDQLTGTFLRKTDEGYTFTYAGERVARTILSGAFHESPTFEPVTVSGRCPVCEHDRFVARPEEATLRIRCEGCEQGVASYPLLPGLIADREPREVVESLVMRMYAHLLQATDGTCAECGGPLDREVHETGVIPNDPFLVVARCEQCWMTYTSPISLWTFTHPATIAFHWERGIDIRTVSCWELFDHLLDDRCRVEQADEGFRVTFADDDAKLLLELSPDVSVEHATRMRTEVD